MRKDLRFRLRSFEFRRCGKVDKKNRRSLKICPGASCAGHPQDIHHPRRHENRQRLAANADNSVLFVGATNLIPPVSTSSLAAGRHNRKNQLDR
jgi:hypothetical protein